MSQKKSKEEARLWLITAKDDLDTAFILKDKNKNAHACFHSHQAAEKGIKAVWYYLDMDPWGHSIFKLIQDLKEVNLEIFEKLKPFINVAKRLDRFYIPTRYPNGLPDITPDMAYSQEDSIYSTSMAKNILDEVEKIVLLNQ